MFKTSHSSSIQPPSTRPFASGLHQPAERFRSVFTELKNGLKVSAVSFPGVKTVSLRCFVFVGSIYETPENNGISHFLWEIGLLGVIIGFPLFYLIFSDAVRVKELDTISGALALGLIGVIGILVLSLPYKNIIPHQTTNYLFLYLAGYTASKRIMMVGEIDKYD